MAVRISSPLFGCLAYTGHSLHTQVSKIFHNRNQFIIGSYAMVETHPGLKCVAASTNTAQEEEKKAQHRKRRKTMPRKWNYICAINTSTHFILFRIFARLITNDHRRFLCVDIFTSTDQINATIFRRTTTNKRIDNFSANNIFRALIKSEPPPPDRVMWNIEIDSKNHVFHFHKTNHYYLWARFVIFFVSFC